MFAEVEEIQICENVWLVVSLDALYDADDKMDADDVASFDDGR